MLRRTDTPHPRPDRRRSRVRLAAAVAAVASLVVAGCTGDGEDDTSGTTTAAPEPSASAVELAQGYRSSVGEDRVTEDEALCFASALIDSLGEDRVRELDDGSITPEDLDASEQDDFVAAHDDCIPGSAFAPEFTDGVFDPLGIDPPEGTVECIGEQLDGRTGRIVMEGGAAVGTDALPESALEAIDACVGPETVSAVLMGELEGQGLDPAVAGCVADQLAEDVTFGELARLGTGDADAEARVDELSRAAITDCT